MAAIFAITIITENIVKMNILRMLQGSFAQIATRNGMKMR